MQSGRSEVLLSALFFLFLVNGCGGSHSTASSTTSATSDATIAGQRQFPLSSLTKSTLTVSGTTLSVYIMDTPAKRAEGMMSLSDADIGANEGMLFVFPDSATRAFWMKDTALPLDIAFMETSGIVENTSPLQPFDLTPVLSAGPSMYVLEVKQGSLARLGVAAGTQATLPSVHADQ